MDVDEAWEHFMKSDTAFARSTTMDGKLDTIAAQLQEMSTNQKRLNDIVIPKLQGEATAMEDDGGDDPLSAVMGGQSPEDILASIQDEGGAEAPEGGEGAPEGAGEEMPEGGDEEMEKSADDYNAKAPVPADVPDMPPAPGEEVSIEVEDVVPDRPEVEKIEPAGQDGIPPEGVPDLLDEINATQPEGLLNIYGRFVEGMKRAAQQAAGNGDLATVTNIAGAQNAIDSIWRGQLAPIMDSLEGGFARSEEGFAKGESMEGITKEERMDDDVAGSHQVPVDDPCTDGEHNTTGRDNDAGAPPAPEGTAEETGAPHALNNDTTTVGSPNPPSFEKSDDGGSEEPLGDDTEPVAKCGTCEEHNMEKSADPPEDGLGMTPVSKSLSDLEGYDQEYADKDEDLDYTDPIKKAVPSFRTCLGEAPESRFMMAAEARRGPHISMEELTDRYDRIFAKSMSEGTVMEGSDPVQGSDDSFAESEGAATAGTEGMDNAVFSDTGDVAKSTAGQAAPVGNVEDAMQKSAEDQLNYVDGAFGKSTAGITPVGDELQGPVSDGETDTGLDDVETKMRKSEQNGRHIASLQEMMSFRKSSVAGSGRPDPISTPNADLVRPDPDSFQKSPGPVVRMGQGVDPRLVTENDWAEYRVYKARGGYNQY